MKEKNITISSIIFCLLCIWCLLPIAALLSGLYLSYRIPSDFQIGFYQLSNYQNIFSFAGTATLMILMFYLLKISPKLTLTLAQIKFYFIKNPWMFLYLLLTLWITISALCSPSLLDAFAGAPYRNMGVFTYVIFGCLLICPHFLPLENKKTVIFYLFIAVADIIAIFMLIQENNIEFINHMFGLLRSGVFIHFNHMGYYLNLACICTSAMFVFIPEKNRYQSIFFLCSLFLLFYSLLINDTMGGILACLITSGVILWFYYLRTKQLHMKQFLPLIIILTLTVLSCFGLFKGSSGGDMSDNFFGLYEDANKLAENQDIGSIGTLRFSLWEYYGKQIPNHPILGLGPDQEPVGYEDHVISDRPANEYLYHAVFHGIPALIFYLGFLISLAVHQFKHIKELSPVTMVAACCVITYCISAFFGNAVYYTACYLFLFLGFVLPDTTSFQNKIN